MREIVRENRFKRDYRRESKGQHRLTLASDLATVVAALANDVLLEPRYEDHALGFSWNGYRDCHIKPDLILIYRKTDDGRLLLARLGSHSELF
jgi:mRNA interferase YafQ